MCKCGCSVFLSVSDRVQNRFLTRLPQVGTLKKSNTEIQSLKEMFHFSVKLVKCAEVYTQLLFVTDGQGQQEQTFSPRTFHNQCETGALWPLNSKHFIHHFIRTKLKERCNLRTWRALSPNHSSVIRQY